MGMSTQKAKKLRRLVGSAAHTATLPPLVASTVEWRLGVEGIHNLYGMDMPFEPGWTAFAYRISYSAQVLSSLWIPHSYRIGE